MKKFLLFSGVLVFLMTVAIFSHSENAVGGATPKSGLPVVGSLKNLQSLLEQMEERNGYYQSRVISESALSITGAPSAGSNKSSADAARQYSATNVQVQGVDEADIVKTDGEYIYHVSKQRVIISKVYPPENMKVVKTIRFTDADFLPLELYVDSSYLVVIGSGYNTVYQKDMAPGLTVEVFPPPSGYNRYVKAIIFDIKDRSNVKKIRELELEGDYVSSRKLGSALYFVANRNIDRYRIMAGREDLPGYKDSAAGSTKKQIGLEKVRYFPGCSIPNYLLVAGLNLNLRDKAANVSSYLGSGEDIYVSPSALYVAVSQWENPGFLFKGKSGILPMSPETNTNIYEFALNAGNVSYVVAGKVPGTVLNQFSMDAYKGYLRVATTTGQVWRQDEGTSKNNVYILDGKLNISGKLENIAPGETIYSARFVEDRAYLVTFKKVDPFFVIDVSSPKAPKVLGALKIPGYSDYLHPVDKNHVLGFGKDTLEQKQTGWDGRETSTAYYQGMKIALFDVSDVSRPVEKFKTLIGDRGTDSPLLRDHKALLFDQSKNLLAFPVTVMEIKGEATGAASHGEFVFQGAYVYSFSLDKGFVFRGRITHLDKEDYQKSGYGWYGSEKNIDRVLFIDNTLYTVSQTAIMANDLQSLSQINKLNMP